MNNSTVTLTSVQARHTELSETKKILDTSDDIIIILELLQRRKMPPQKSQHAAE